jgi:hypothetical protein
LGLGKFDDQSTNYGFFIGTKEELVTQLRELKGKYLTENDTVTLFYAMAKSLDKEEID